jgi:hypothetical protein
VTLPWSKFFWSDYASDPALKLCSFAAQGLWMRMLCLAAEHDPPGYVAINGRGLEPKDIARITGGSLDEVSALTSELESNGVFSRDRRGWIYSRRMKNEAKKRDIAAQNGKKGGNPSLTKQKENPASDKGEDNGSLNGQANPQKPEARSQSSSVDKSTGAKPLQNDPAKDLFEIGVSLLTDGGLSEKESRSLIGKWRKDRGVGEVVSALFECRAQAISEPVEWLTKRLQKARWVSKSGYEYRGSDEAVLREAEFRADWDTAYSVKAAIAGRKSGTG